MTRALFGAKTHPSHGGRVEAALTHSLAGRLVRWVGASNQKTASKKTPKREKSTQIRTYCKRSKKKRKSHKSMATLLKVQRQNGTGWNKVKIAKIFECGCT